MTTAWSGKGLLISRYYCFMITIYLFFFYYPNESMQANINLQNKCMWVFFFLRLMRGCYAIVRIVVKSQRRTWGVGGFVWFQCHVHCKSGATTEQIIGLLLSAAVSDRWKWSIWSEQTHACTYSDEKRASMEVNDITSWAVTLLKKHKADCSWCYIAITLFHA